jgi:D-alanyl-lipoteichoic acid acyltransferase DltB (MBOAT superfamily)
MLFTTGIFLFLYLPVTLVLFFAVAKLLGRGAAAAWLALASLFFYGFWIPAYTALLLGSVIANYGFGNLILRSERGARRVALFVAVGTNLCVLAYFKYANFFLQSVNVVGGTHFDVLPIVLPLGISFFTFTQIAYLVDVFDGKVEERNPVHYLLFVTYFPHLIAGPVLHHSEMMPQFRRAENYSPHVENFAVGLAFLAIGLGKKILIADSIAPVANGIFDNYLRQGIGIVHAWVGVLAYAFQIYFDFSGYSDMAVGLSLLVGVQLPYNFNSPYKARNIIDFWRRWHMTLSRFLRDYLYFALGGNRKGPVRRHLNLMVTMLLGGLWHGASWTFVLWGGLHGTFLVVNHGWRFLCERSRIVARAVRWRPCFVLAQVAAAVLTLLCVLVAWVFFRAKTVAAAFSICASMFWQSHGATVSPADLSLLPWLAALSVVVLAAPNSQQFIDGQMRVRLPQLRLWSHAHELLAFLAGVEVVAIVLLALIAARRESTEFIYFNF